MTLKLGWHRRLAQAFGYDIDKFNKQLTVETHLRELLPRLGVDLVLDVGANEGQYVGVLRHVGYTGQIISFEPSAEAFAKLAQAAAKDDSWQVFNIALGDATGEATLNISGASVFNSLHQSNEFGKAKYGAAIESPIEAPSTETVSVERLDTILHMLREEKVVDFADRNVFLKMDTQGHDSAVFDGAGEYASRFSGLQSEIAVTPIYDGIPDYMDSIALYRSFGYEVTGLYTVNRHRVTGHVIEFDCVMAPRMTS